MRVIRTEDPQYCECCATDFVLGQLALDGIIYGIPVVVCGRYCFNDLYYRWEPVSGDARQAWHRIPTKTPGSEAAIL